MLAGVLGAWDRAGFRDLDFLLVLRNPVDQSLATNTGPSRAPPATLPPGAEADRAIPGERQTGDHDGH